MQDESDETISHWLVVERLENWKIDEAGGFCQFGLSHQKEVIGRKVKKGDWLIFYVSSSIAAFSDVREATADGVSPSAHYTGYDLPFPWRLETRSLLVLPRERWVPARNVIANLSIAIGHKDWRLLMRNSIRRLTVADAGLILKAMNQAARGAV
jgi:hypothetical protein